jgi:hypothetical protein
MIKCNKINYVPNPEVVRSLAPRSLPAHPVDVLLATVLVWNPCYMIVSEWLNFKPKIRFRKTPQKCMCCCGLFKNVCAAVDCYGDLHSTFLMCACVYVWTARNWCGRVWYVFVRASSLYSSSSSTGTTAHCGLWPVEQYPSIFSYMSPTLSIIIKSIHLFPLFDFRNNKFFTVWGC